MVAGRYVVVLLAVLAAVPAGASADDPQQVVVKAKRDTSTVVIKGVRDPSAWFRIESPHLIVYSDDDPDQVIDLVDNLEKLDYVLRLYMKPFMDPRVAMPKFRLYYRHRAGWPAEFGAHPDDAIALTESCVAATQAFTSNVGAMWKLNNASLLRPEDDFTLMWNLSLYAGNFLYRHTRIRGPLWFMSGFGAYFGGMRFTDNQMLVGRDAGTSYDLLQQIDEGKIRRLSFDQVMHYEAVRKSIDDPIKFGTPDYYDVWEFLGRAFNLVHYVYASEDKRSKLETYLEAVADGADAGTAFSDIFGIRASDIDRTMWRYRQQDMKVLQVDVPDLPRPRIEFTRLSRIEGDFVMDNALAKTCLAPAQGKALLMRLQQTAAQASAVDFARMTLSRAQVEWGDPRDALAYLSRAVEKDPYESEPHYLLGLAHLKLAQVAGEYRAAQLAVARISLAQAATLAPESPEIAYALFRTELMGTAPTEEGVARAIAAWRHGRDVAAFARAAGLASAWLGDAAGAFQALNALAQNTSDPGNAQWAAAWLARLEKGVPRDELLAAMREETPVPTGGRKWGYGYR